MADARRKAEIEAKRLKLQELRQAREARKNILAADREQLQGSGDLKDDARPSSRAQLDDLVSSLLAPSSRDTASPGLYDSRSSQASDGPPRDAVHDHHHHHQHDSSRSTHPLTQNNSQFPDFVDVEKELFELSASKSTITYNKAVQTTPSVSTGSGPDQSTGGVGTSTVQTPTTATALPQQPTEDQLRASILADLATESTAAQLESDEQLLRGLSYDELQAIYASSDFASFLESSSKIVQRALSDRYDYLRDYSLSATADETDSSESRHVRYVCAFQDDRWTKNRSVTDVDWSYKYPELVLASYNKNPFAVNDPDGIVCVWNLHLRERPEFVFHSQSDVLSAIFSPFQPNTIIGGTYSGQVLIWDTRAKHAPVQKTPLSAAGHTHPVYSLHVVGTQNSHNLVSASTDGMICTWLMDVPSRPQETLELVYPSHAKTDEVSVTCLGSPYNETGTLYVGTEEGPVFVANRFDRAGTKAGLVHNEVYKSHSGPITGLDFHPIRGPVDFGDLFLTSGVDWTVKLWRARSGIVDSNSTSSSTKRNVSGGKPTSNPSATAGGTTTSTKPSSVKPTLATTNPSAASASSTISPLATFEGYDDYVTDIKWHPTHPAVFASVDGSGHFDIWNLNIDTEVPAVSTIVSPNNSNINNTNKLSHEEMSNNDLRIPQAGLNKLAWDRGGISTSSTSTRAKSSKTAKTTADLDSKTKTTTITKDGTPTTLTDTAADAVADTDNSDQKQTPRTTTTLLPGSKVAIGSSDGRLYVYDVSDAIVGSNDSDWDTFRKTCSTISQRGLGGTWAM